MAEFMPFNGIRYNPGLNGNMAAVVAPPYDVISPEEQERYHARHPHNVIRLILGSRQPGDDLKSNPHTRAADFLRKWLEASILIREPEGAIYMTSITFAYEGQRITRFGIIGRVRLMPFEEGIILPHERTFSNVKTEQLRLMQACHANLSPIFGLYADGEGILAELKKIAQTTRPAIAFTDDQAFQHAVWPLRDPEQVAFLTDAMRDLRIYIADGHHRYETALNYRDWLARQQSALPEDHPANFVMMSLSSIDDPGMVILSAHRLLKEVPADAMHDFIVRAETFFDVSRFPIQNGGSQALASARALQKSHAVDNAIIAILPPHDEILVMILKPGVMKEYFQEEPEPLRDLDVTVLTRLVMMGLLGFDQARLDDDKKIAYCTDPRRCLESVRNGAADMAFILNPTRIAQVKKVSEHGLIMPRKSTYFYPKVISGLVINPLWQ